MAHAAIHLEVTNRLPARPAALIDLLATADSEIRVHVRQLPIPAEFISGDYENDAEFRRAVSGVDERAMEEKDALIARMRVTPLPLAVEGMGEGVA